MFEESESASLTAYLCCARRASSRRSRRLRVAHARHRGVHFYPDDSARLCPGRMRTRSGVVRRRPLPVSFCSFREERSSHIWFGHISHRQRPWLQASVA